MNKLKIYIFAFLYLGIMSGCSFFEAEIPEPAFLDLKSPTLTNNLGQKETHNITDVWVFQDGQILGIFPLPSKVPYTASTASTTIKIVPGIRSNGMQDRAALYAFYEGVETTVSYNPGKTIEIPLNFGFKSNIKIPINESFEFENSFSIDLDLNTNSKLSIDETTSSLGNKSAVMNMTSTTSFAEVASTRAILPSEISGGTSYFEFDYKGEGEIAVGVIKSRNGIFSTEYILFVPGKPNWNRIYVDITDKVQDKNFDSYRISLAFRKPDFALQSRLYIDNIKHFHF
jgi:hypothetical protein